jgi:hypothetical protein
LPADYHGHQIAALYLAFECDEGPLLVGQSRIGCGAKRFREKFVAPVSLQEHPKMVKFRVCLRGRSVSRDEVLYALGIVEPHKSEKGALHRNLWVCEAADLNVWSFLQVAS